MHGHKLTPDQRPLFYWTVYSEEVLQNAFLIFFIVLSSRQEEKQSWLKMVFSFVRFEHLQRLISNYQNRWTESIKTWQQIKASAKEFMTLDFAQGVICTQLITDFRENSLQGKQCRNSLISNIMTWEIQRFLSLPWLSLWEVSKNMTSPNLTTAKSLSKDSTTEGCSGKTDYCSTSDVSTEESKWSSLLSSHFPMRIPPKKGWKESVCWGRGSCLHYY